MNRGDFTEANRLSWNAAEPHHRQAKFAEWVEHFSDPSYVCFPDVLISELKKIGVAGTDCAQLCCNNGRNLISLRHMGANRIVGFDISDAFIAQGIELANACGCESELHRCDIYQVPDSFDAQFHLVLFTVGALCWLPELAPALGTATRLLRPGGALVIHDIHPVILMWDQEGSGYPVSPDLPYFNPKPYESTEGLDYFTGKSHDSPVNYEFSYTISDIIQGCIDHGLNIRRFLEFPEDAAGCWQEVTALEARPPMSLVLVAQTAPIRE